jgi:hypothetical protein
MKLLSICLLAAAFLTFLSGCVTEYTDSQGYTSRKKPPRNAVYEPQR